MSNSTGLFSHSTAEVDYQGFSTKMYDIVVPLATECSAMR